MADSSESPQQSEPVGNFFRKPSKNKNIRKWTYDGYENDNEDSRAENLLMHNKEQPPWPNNKHQFSTGPSKLSMSSQSNVESKASVFQFESSKEIKVQVDGTATATLEYETEFLKDTRAIQKRVLNQAEAMLKAKGNNPGNEKFCIMGFMDMQITKVDSKQSRQFQQKKLVGTWASYGFCLCKSFSKV